MQSVYQNLAAEEAKTDNFRKQQNNQANSELTNYISDSNTADTLLPNYNHKKLTSKDLCIAVANNTNAYVKQLAMEKQKLALDQLGINKCRQFLYKLNNKVMAASKVALLFLGVILVLLIVFQNSPIVPLISVLLIIKITAIVVAYLGLLYLDNKIARDQEKSQHKIEKNNIYLPKLAGMMKRIFKEMSKRQADLATDTTIIEQNIADLLNIKTTTTIDKFKKLSDQYVDCLCQARLNYEISQISLTKLQKATEELLTNILTTLSKGLPKDDKFIARFIKVLLGGISNNIYNVHKTLRDGNEKADDNFLKNTIRTDKKYLQNIKDYISAGVKASYEAFSKEQ